MVFSNKITAAAVKDVSQDNSEQNISNKTDSSNPK